MNAPAERIGRYVFSVSAVVAIKQGRGWRAWFAPYWIFHFTNGTKLQLNAAEKAAYDEAVAIHGKTVAVLEMVGRMQQFNRPAA